MTPISFAKEAQKGMSSPSLQGTKPVAEGLQVLVGRGLGPLEGPSMFGFRDGLCAKIVGSALSITCCEWLLSQIPEWCVRMWKTGDAHGKGKLGVGGMAHQGGEPCG